MPTVGIVSPGAMGSAVAGALTREGVRVVATLDGRSERTKGLAARAPLELLPDLAAVVRNSEVVLSIVPPDAARAVAGDVARAADTAHVAPLLVDLNAIAPATAEAVAQCGLDVVDGSISGPPPWRSGTTRIYLSGPRAEEVASLRFDGVSTIVVGRDVGLASAVKMSTASVYKGTTAVVMQALRAAHANGVLEHVLADLGAGAPHLLDDIERRLSLAAAKAHRYVGEMREIAATQGAAGLTPALFDALAEVYADAARRPLAATNPDEVAPDELSQVLDALRAG